MTTGDGVLEQALLPVRTGQEEAFEAAFGEAVEIIAASPGFRSVRLERCLEQPVPERTTYLLLVAWDTLEDHTEGFRGSPAYARWRALLHGFYDPFPQVLHFTGVLAR